MVQKADEEESNHKVELRRCQVGRVGTGALTVAGDIAVTIKGNVFNNLASQAFKVSLSVMLLRLPLYVKGQP